MNKKIRVVILCGGKSAEHEVSLQSAKNVADAIDKKRYEVCIIGIDKGGRWHLLEHVNFLINGNDPKLISLNTTNTTAVSDDANLTTISATIGLAAADVVFPVLHGPFGEDGIVQGLLRLADLPFVGSDVIGSAVGMDKDIMRRLLQDADLPVVKYLAFKTQPDFARVSAELGLPLFIKPANMGSSIGVSKATDEKSFDAAVTAAFSHDRKIIIEEYVQARELECAILGNDSPSASIVGEIIANHDFYSYEAKYIDDNGAALVIPASVPAAISDKIRQLALQAFKVLEAAGLARVDFFLTPDHRIYINEINTMPGFTKISMYPRLWQASGLDYSDLIDRLLQLALARFAHNKSSDRPEL